MSKAQCLDCQDIIESKHKNDFVRCKCGNSFIDGGDEYLITSGRLVILDGEQRLSPMELFMNDSEPISIRQRDEAMARLIEDIETEEYFDDDSFLGDEDMADFNLGYQAGVMSERERILHEMQRLEDQSNATRTPLYQDTMFAKIRNIING
jgi:hypothetical protein